MPRTRAGSANEKGPGASGRGRRRQRDVARRRGQRQPHPGIEAQLLPTHECDASAGREARAQVRERRDRIGEEHHAEAAEDQIEGRGAERRRLGIGVQEARVRESALGRARPRALEHRAGDVDAGDRAARSDLLGELQASSARSRSRRRARARPRRRAPAPSPRGRAARSARRASPRRRPSADRTARSTGGSARHSVRWRRAVGMRAPGACVADHITAFGARAASGRGASRARASREALEETRARPGARAKAPSRCGVCTWQSTKSKSQSASCRTSVAKATFEASGRSVNIDSPKKAPPSETP